MLNFDNFSIVSVDRFTFKSATTGAIHFIAEELQSFTLTCGEEVVFQTGRTARRLSSMKRNKTSSISFDSGYVSLSQMGAQIGVKADSFDTATMPSPQVEYVIVGADGKTATTKYKAEGVAGSELRVIYRANTDGTPGEMLVQAAAAAEGKFAYDPTTKEITLDTTGFTEGDRLLVSYEYKTKGKRIVNDSSTFSLNGEGIFEATLHSACDQETNYCGKLWIPNLSANGSFELIMGGDQTIQTFGGESLASSCLGGSYWSWIIPEDDAD